MMTDPKTVAMLARIDANVVALSEMVSRHLAEDTRVHADLETRLRSQEKFRYGALAVAALLTVGSGGFFTFLT